jgi:hypothetical protein
MAELGGPTILDGEIVALDEQGHPRFECYRREHFVPIDACQATLAFRPTQQSEHTDDNKSDDTLISV